MMRDEKLEELTSGLVEMSHLAGTAMARATTALLSADLQMAQAVVDGDDRIDAMQEELDEQALNLLALHQPVAGDLRTIVAAMRISSMLERMGDMAEHLARVARRRHPAHAVPDEMRATFLEMGQIAERLAEKAAAVVASQDVDTALELEGDDDRMDTLHRELFTTMTDADWPHDVETAIDLTLASHYYERFADHAVSIAGRVVFLATGERYEDLLARRG